LWRICDRAAGLSRHAFTYLVRAGHIDLSAIEPLGVGWCIVPSSRDPTGYAVHVEFDSAHQRVEAFCTYPDFDMRAPNLRGVRPGPLPLGWLFPRLPTAPL
jgi:hypothetical protein